MTRKVMQRGALPQVYICTLLATSVTHPVPSLGQVYSKLQIHAATFHRNRLRVTPPPKDCWTVGL